ncbi:hypothetical protein DAPPUDRAFT_239025 [Daphnia pulex]|uniref:Uncharacterized protein n=1 Tax=Daphnia pulex TaxID=6669 RepID=E9G852_DAPPU|nr:hypothetical protein DAPPUDRAFT_239025 [Daphnia pulex]|eukprot:EFX83914.1 hypothetical protein DAPPUDRAFT_239025 [Daphnia pulex]
MEYLFIHRRNESNDSNVNWYTVNPSPSNVKMQKERPVCMSLTLEGHGDHYVKRAMQCRPIPQQRQNAEGKASLHVFLIEGHGDLYVKRVMQWCRVNYGVVLMSGVVSLMAASTTGVLMSPGYGGCQATAAKVYYTTLPSYYTTTSIYVKPTYYTEAPNYYTEATKYYSAPRNITKALEYYITTYAAPAYYTDDKYYSVPRYCAKAQVYYTTKAVEYYTEAPKYYNATYTAPA